MTARFTLTVEALHAPYIPSVLIAFQAVTAAAILLEAAKAWAEPWRFAAAGTVLLSCFGAAAVFVASNACVEFYDIPSVLPKDTAASLISLAVLCACAFAYRGKLNRYALGASPVLAANTLFPLSAKRSISHPLCARSSASYSPTIIRLLLR